VISLGDVTVGGSALDVQAMAIQQGACVTSDGSAILPCPAGLYPGATIPNTASSPAPVNYSLLQAGSPTSSMSSGVVLMVAGGILLFALLARR